MASKQIFGPSAPSVEHVTYRGGVVETRGLKLGSQLIELISKFPSVIGMLDTSKKDGDPTTLADDAITTIIAMGTGVYGDEAQTGYIAEMSAGERAAFMASIIRQTAPTGIGPFVELLLSLGAQAVTAAEGDENTPIKMRSKKPSGLPPNFASRVSIAAA